MTVVIDPGVIPSDCVVIDPGVIPSDCVVIDPGVIPSDCVVIDHVSPGLPSSGGPAAAVRLLSLPG